MGNFGALVTHSSTVRPNTTITLERGWKGAYFVRTRTAGSITRTETPMYTENSGRELFERAVQAHFERGKSWRSNQFRLRF